MRFALSVALISVFGTSLWAQSAQVRSGEHADYSRLVIDITVGAQWDTSTAADGFIVRISGQSGYNLGAVFDRIPRDRINDLRVAPNNQALLILSDCQCVIDAFLWKPDKLVVDVRDKVSNRVTPEDKPVRPSEVFTLPILTDRNRQPRSVPALIVDQALDNSSQVSDFEKIIIESIARGASQGLLQPSKAIQTAQTAIIDSHISKNQPGLWAHTSIDRAQTQSLVVDMEKTTCLPDTMFDLPAWGGGMPFAPHISKLRSAVTREFDKIDPEGVLNLARGYLFYGFGREAITTLNIDRVSSQERLVVNALAAIMDGNPGNGYLYAHAKCDGPAALWAFLATSDALAVDLDRNAILRAFSALPPHLQTHLGPKLSTKFIQRGDTEAARMSLVTGTTNPDGTIENTLAATQLQAELGAVADASNTLANLATTDTRMTPDALIDYFELAISTDQQINPEALALADIFRFEQRGTSILGDLAAAQVAAFLATGDVSNALNIVATETEAIGPERKLALNSNAVLLASDTMDAMSFLDLAFQDVVIETDAKAQNAIATRLLELGFPERAGVLVSGAAVGDAMIERRFLRAKAALDREDPNAVLIHLLGQSSERAVELRKSAEFLLDGRDYLVATKVADDWRLGNWAALSQGEDKLLETVSLSILDDQRTVPDPSEPLAQGRALLSQSEKTRALLDDVFARFGPLVE
jgi:hypothetical protein